ncbi:carboxylesterase family protein [Flavobacterium proteolyticum]|uniref:Prolyl oligopeptidase family serine peptidase n=1 Tax=Flavobacterium proteolyticum TaxID=2911683 RepID=A0ABR9WMN4_9FLAO|nr:prolyl oligopeptidase family serine peptidase [Flavobacterium proteolyticum]MBE9575092.1 prolyl oligopeptidase family serine peptidase [Flavobacterium proteolyticum]
MKLKQLYIALFILSSAFGFSQLKTITNKTTYPFWINVPEKESTEKQPVLIFLHGKSLSGTDLNRVRRYGVLRAMDKGRKIPAIVVAPQLAKGSWNPDNVLEVLEYVKKNYNVDESRIYVCGMSLGGYGTLHFAGKYADKITAAVAICGGGNVKDGCKLATIPLWIQHGDIDYIVPMSESKKVVDAIKKCDEKADVTLTIIKGGNHGNVERLFHEDAMYDWLFKQKRE